MIDKGIGWSRDGRIEGGEERRGEERRGEERRRLTTPAACLDVWIGWTLF
jgi:hypothetical protein